MTGVFITGTDTGVGKTHVSIEILKAAKARGLTTAVMKPVASGAEASGDGLRNADALQLMTAATHTQPYHEVSPYAFAPAIAPHLAAAEAGQVLELQHIQHLYRHNAAAVDLCLVEGVGGWCVPLGENLMLADLVRSLDIPVLLVVGMRLGCLNHALLSAAQVPADGHHLVGWVANQVDVHMSHYQENLETLQGLIDAPLVGQLAYTELPNGSQNEPENDFSELFVRLGLI